MKGINTNLLSRFQINQLSHNAKHRLFKVKQMKEPIHASSNQVESAEQNVRAKMDLFHALKEHVERGKVKNKIYYSIIDNTRAQ